MRYSQAFPIPSCFSRRRFDFPDTDEPHGEMSVVLVPDRLEARGVPGPLSMLVARSVGAHHVAFADAGKLAEINDVSRHRCRSPHWGKLAKRSSMTW